MPVIKYPSQRVAVLIDVQNLYHSAKNIHGRRVNFKEILSAGVGNRELVRAFAYVVRTETEEEKQFFEVLHKMGIEIRVKDLQIFFGGAKKADWDVGIAIDGVRLSERVDVIILMSGDGDFIPFVEYLKNKGTQIEVMAFGESTSSGLREAADDFIDLSESPQMLLRKRTTNSKDET